MAGRRNKFDYCTLWFCDEPHYGRGLCARHYQNWLRTGYPLPEQSDDLRTTLKVIEQFRSLITTVLFGNNAYFMTMDGDETVNSKCKYCGRDAHYKHQVDHKADCPVSKAEFLLSHTYSIPPDDKYTYEL